MLYDVIVIGGGPAGIAAAITVARQELKVMLIADSLLGQLSEIGQVENWLGEQGITGSQLADKFKRHLMGLAASLEHQKTRATKIQKMNQLLLITLADGNTVTARSAILAMGARHKTLNIPGEAKLLGKGVSYCVTCDAPYYKKKTVAVYGDSGYAASVAAHLGKIATHVYLLQPQPASRSFSGSTKISLLPKAQLVKIIGDQKVAGLKYRSGGKTKELEVDGVFIATESVPNIELVNNWLECDKEGHIKVNHQLMSTSELGVFAAGDVTNGHYKQISTAVGDGVKAALSAMNYIDKSFKKEVRR